MAEEFTLVIETFVICKPWLSRAGFKSAVPLAKSVLSFADPNGDIASESGYSKPDMEMPSLLRKILMWDLIKGLSVTFRYQHPKEIYTEQYPLERPRYTREGAIWNREMLEKGPQPTQYRK